MKSQSSCASSLTGGCPASESTEGFEELAEVSEPAASQLRCTVQFPILNVRAIFRIPLP